MKCGECTVCCTLLDIPWMDSPAGEPCKYCDKGCTIYATVDDRCSEFKCAYNQMDNVSEKLRPDNCGIIFERIEDDLMFGTVNPNHTEFQFVHGQINAFIQEGINVVLSKEGQPVVYHIDGVKPEDLLSRVYKIARGQNGSSSI